MQLVNKARNYFDYLGHFISSQIIDRNFWRRAKQNSREFLSQQTQMIRREVKRLNEYQSTCPPCLNLEEEISLVIAEHTEMFEYVLKNRGTYSTDAPKEMNEYLLAIEKLDKAIHLHDSDWPILS